MRVPTESRPRPRRTSTSTPWKLTLAEAATIAGLPAGPSRFNPRLDLGAAEGRRNWVLDRMATLGMIRPERAARAKDAPLRIREATPPVLRAPYFVDHLTRDLKRRYGEDMLYRGGLRVETTLDFDLQRAAERAVAGVLDRPGDPQAALVAIDVRTGGILAWWDGATSIARR